MISGLIAYELLFGMMHDDSGHWVPILMINIWNISPLHLVFLYAIWHLSLMPLTELKGLDLQTSFFTYRQIKVATYNFNATNKIGEGSFGSVYKVFDSSFSILEWIYFSILSFYSPYWSLALGERDKKKYIPKECIFSILDARYSIWWYCNCS